jgi:hypothetical protein
MAHTLKITLNDAQWEILQERAENAEQDAEDTAYLAEDLVKVWYGRVRALSKYARKLQKDDATFRPYVPLGFEEKQREKIKAEAIKEGIAPKPQRSGAAPKAKAKKTGKAKAAQPRLPGVS